MPELLCPAGNFEKMKAAILYGADAVYLAGKAFGMRSAADNFERDELEQAVLYAHERGKRVYVTVNIMPHTKQYETLGEYLRFLSEIHVDALIVSDLGVLSLVRKLTPGMEIHVSTQASVVSAPAAIAYHELGAKRVVLARELTYDEVVEIRKNTPASLELEAFVHGSMCVSYSGRCLLSAYFTGRDGNRGACTQPCRWNYKTLTVAEEKRPGDPLPIEEHEEGTFIMSSKDMCMIGRIPELMESGIDSFKVEGRMKSAYYTAVVANAYRMAIDAYKKDPAGYRFDPAWLRELESVSHREYATGFWFDGPMDNAQLVEKPGYLREKAYLAVAGDTSPDGFVSFTQRNKVSVGDSVDLLSPGKCGIPFTVEEMIGEDGAPIPSAPHPSMKFAIRVPFPVKPGDILRGGGLN